MMRWPGGWTSDAPKFHGDYVDFEGTGFSWIDFSWFSWIKSPRPATDLPSVDGEEQLATIAASDSPDTARSIPATARSCLDPSAFVQVTEVLLRLEGIIWKSNELRAPGA